MPPARVVACQALLLALATSACAVSTPLDGEGEGEGETGEQEPPEADVELRCGAEVAPPLSAFGPFGSAATLGPCGHLAYHDDQGEGYLIAPDGEHQSFSHGGHRTRFAPTGDLLAWGRDLDDGLYLRDLNSGMERTIQASGAVDAFGFVPSFADAARSAWLWSCEQGVLERHDIDDGQVVAESVDCSKVVGSTGMPRLAFGDTDGRVWIADLDDGEQIETADAQYSASGDRDDSLWIDHDGELVVHVAIEWQGDESSDAEWPVELWARVLDRQGEIVIDSPSGLAVRQAPRRGAPVFVFRQGEIVRFDDGAPSSVEVALSRSELTESGALFFSTETDEVLVAEADAGEPLTSVGEFLTPVELRPSRNGEHAAVEHHSEICIVDEQGECDRILLTLRRWSREQGLASGELLSTSPWNLEATLDDGSLLVVGAPVDAEGLTYTGEQPQPRVLLLDGDGQIQAELPAGNGDLAIRQTFVLTDDRVLFEYQPESGVGELVMGSAADGFVSLVPNVDVALLEAWVDARAQRVVFVAEGPDGDTLWYGAP